jgi:predicted glycogen debranching enzyme
MSFTSGDRREWLEADGLGGFASGTAAGVRTRRYHALLLSAATPPTGRFALVGALDAALRTPAGESPLSSHRFEPGVTTGADPAWLESFTHEPWPRWVYRLPDGTVVAHEVFVPKGSPEVVASWRVLSPARPMSPLLLRVRPLLSGRDYHALHHENPAFRFEPEASADGRTLRWSPYPGVPRILARHTGQYTHDPAWYRGFRYEQELERGFEATEDLASPGTIEFDLGAGGGEAVLVLSADAAADPVPLPAADAAEHAAALRANESARRARFASPLDRAADAYIVARGPGSTIIAGYPWFADWGRDTFIALRGLCLATGRLDDARHILLNWAGSVSDGMLPNRFPDQGDAPEYNSVDAALWYVIAAHELMEEARRAGRPLSATDADALSRATQAILVGYASGTRHGIRLGDDGLLAAGEPGVQLTWMDAKVGRHVVTPRTGKPVEVQALWLNALRIGAEWAPRWSGVYERGLRSFRAKFWNEAEGCLFDVVDAGHIPGATDACIRPNQILAVGGLPFCLLTRPKAERVVKRIEGSLLAPLGLRSLAPGHAEYTGRYEGGPEQRDRSYHQGTVWPWLIGPFVEAWLRLYGDSQRHRLLARQRFLEPLLRHLGEAGLGHVSEIVDAEAPHTPRGCPFQAWSLGELLRLDRRVLMAPPAAPPAAPTDAAGERAVRRSGAAALSAP